MNEKEKSIEQKIADGISKGIQDAKQKEARAKSGGGFKAILAIFLTLITVVFLSGYYTNITGIKDKTEEMGTFAFWASVIVCNIYMYLLGRKDIKQLKEDKEYNAIFITFLMVIVGSFVWGFFISLLFTP